MPSLAPKQLPRLSRSIESLRADLYARIDAVQDDFAARGWLPARLNLNKGVVRGLIELFAWGQWQVYILMERVLGQAVPQTASGDWLDVHADSVDLARRPATKARGVVLFLRSPANTGNVKIPAGRIVRTKPDGKGEVFRYVTSADAVLPAEAHSVPIPVISEEYGAAANAGTGQICELATPVPGVAGVINSPDWLTFEGANEETDAQLAERYRLRWMSNNGCTKYAYMAWALSVPGVSSVSILDRHPRGQGTVDVVVRGSAVLPTEALLEQVRAAVAPNTPINDDWQVRSPDPAPVIISGVLELVAGDPVRIKTAAEARILALFADVSDFSDVIPLQIGEDLPLDRLTHTVMAVPGVKRVTWTQPAADCSVSRAGLAVLDSLTLTTSTATEL